MEGASTVDNVASYKKKSLLGTGSFGKVWMGYHVRTLKNIVIKEVDLTHLNAKDMRMARKEVEFVSKLKHPNIIGYLTSSTDNSSLVIVLEFAENGDLSRRINRQRGMPFGEKKILYWFVQLMAALHFVHSQNVLHRDLKSQNLLLTADDTIKLADFGIAYQLKEFGGRANTALGTPYFLSPEICCLQQYDYKSDIWSAGCILYEMAALKVPFQGKDVVEVIRKIKEGRIPALPRLYEGLVWRLVTSMLQRDSQKRPSAIKILSTPELKSFVIAYEHRYGSQSLLVEEENRTPSVSRSYLRSASMTSQRRSAVPSTSSKNNRLPVPPSPYTFRASSNNQITLTPVPEHVNNVSLFGVGSAPRTSGRHLLNNDATTSLAVQQHHAHTAAQQESSSAKQEPEKPVSGKRKNVEGNCSPKRARFSALENSPFLPSSPRFTSRQKSTLPNSRKRLSIANSKPMQKVPLSPVPEQPFRFAAQLPPTQAAPSIANRCAPRLSLLPKLTTPAKAVKRNNCPVNVHESSESASVDVFNPAINFASEEVLLDVGSKQQLSAISAVQLLYQFRNGQLTRNDICKEVRDHFGTQSMTELRLLLTQDESFDKLVRFVSEINVHVLMLALVVDL